MCNSRREAVLRSRIYRHDNLKKIWPLAAVIFPRTRPRIRIYPSEEGRPPSILKRCLLRSGVIVDGGNQNGLAYGLAHVGWSDLGASNASFVPGLRISNSGSLNRAHAAVVDDSQDAPQRRSSVARGPARRPPQQQCLMNILGRSAVRPRRLSRRTGAPLPCLTASLPRGQACCQMLA